MPNTEDKRKLPQSPNGTMRRIANGMSRLSYRQHSMMYMNTRLMASIKAVELPCDDSSRESPPNS